MSESQKNFAEPQPTATTAAFRFMVFTFIAAAIASAAAFGTLSLGFAPWLMFVGWVTYFTRPASFVQGLASGLCLWLGVVAGAMASLALGELMPLMGQAAIAAVVFVIASVVISLREVPMLNNILAWFLGLIAFFAAHAEPALEPVLVTGSVATLGMLAGWSAQVLQQRFVAESH